MNLFKSWKASKKFRRNFILFIIVFLLAVNFLPFAKKEAKTFVPQATCDSALTKTSCEAKSCYWLQSAKSNTAVAIKTTAAGAAAWAGAVQGCTIGGGTGAVASTPTAGTASIITIPAGCIIGGTVGAVGGVIAVCGGAKALDYVTGILTSPCYSCVQDTYVTKSAKDCCSGYAKELYVESILGISLLDKKNYVCYTPEKSEQCTSWAKPFASILDSVWKGAPNSIESCTTRAYIVMGASALMFLAVI
jgi:hypothetical protein